MKQSNFTKAQIVAAIEKQEALANQDTITRPEKGFSALNEKAPDESGALINKVNPIDKTSNQLLSFFEKIYATHDKGASIKLRSQ